MFVRAISQISKATLRSSIVSSKQIHQKAHSDLASIFYLKPQKLNIAPSPQRFFAADSFSKSKARSEGLAFFNHKFEKFKKHPACSHKIFPYFTQLAESGTLSKEQYLLFCQLMLARIFLTMPSIAQHAEYALRRGDKKMFATVFQNIKEEGGDGDIRRMHPLLAEKAFNAIGKHVFGLDYLSMKKAFSQVHALPEFWVYVATVGHLYKEKPVFVSLAQETASGGNGTTGMMADLYRFFRVYRTQIPKSVFEKEILPYFQEHLALTSQGEFRDNAHEGIECQHAKRAKKDALAKIQTLNQAKVAIAVMNAFGQVQDLLFKAGIKAAQDKVSIS